jgi:hypothetical protein
MRATIRFSKSYDLDRHRTIRGQKILVLESENKVEADLLKHWSIMTGKVLGFGTETKAGKISKRTLEIRFEKQSEELKEHG